MVKISADLISRSAQYLNAIKEFQLDLRGYKINAIENLTATNDQFGCIDFTDNAVIKLSPLPKLNRLRTLLLINNRINKIEKDFAIYCPYLENIILTNNKVSSVTEIDNISSCKSLVRLSLVDNLVTKIKHYRLYVIYKMPNLRVLDFQKVKLKEKMAALKLFNGPKGKELIEDMLSKKFKGGEETDDDSKDLQQILKDENKKKLILVNFPLIKNLINNANSLDEIKKIEKSLQLGNIEKEFLTKDDEENTVYKQNI